VVKQNGQIHVMVLFLVNTGSTARVAHKPSLCLRVSCALFMCKNALSQILLWQVRTEFLKQQSPVVWMRAVKNRDILTFYLGFVWYQTIYYYVIRCSLRFSISKEHLMGHPCLSHLSSHYNNNGLGYHCCICYSRVCPADASLPMMWHKECLWNFSVLQIVHHFSRCCCCCCCCCYYYYYYYYY
jgi:hypothetical protein